MFSTFFHVHALAFSVHQLTSVAACDLVLASAGRERAGLLNRQQNIQFQSTQLAGSAPEVQAELAGITAQLNGINAMLPGLPEGAAKAKYTTEKERLEYQQKVVAKRADNGGVLALLDRELDLARISAELTALDGFIAEVQARRAAL